MLYISYLSTWSSLGLVICLSKKRCSIIVSSKYLVNVITILWHANLSLLTINNTDNKIVDVRWFDSWSLIGHISCICSDQICPDSSSFVYYLTIYLPEYRRTSNCFLLNDVISWSTLYKSASFVLVFLYKSEYFVLFCWIETYLIRNWLFGKKDSVI